MTDPTTRVFFAILSVFFSPLTLLLALQLWIRICIVQNDTRGVEWLIPLARIRFRGDGENPERNWLNSAVAMVICAFGSVVFITTALK